MKKLLLTLLVVLSFSFLFTQASYSETELQEAIDWMYDNGLTRYETPYEFMSNDPINREQASKFFGVLATTVYNKTTESTNNCNFIDIKKADSTLQSNIIDACELGIFNGYKQSFDPKRNLSNAEGLAVLTRIADYMPSENQNPWYKKYYDMLLFRGVIDTEGLRLKDQGFAEQKATRGEIAVMIYKTYEQKLIKDEAEIDKGNQTEEETKEEIEESYTKNFPLLDQSLSINFSHDFSNSPKLTEEKKQIIRITFDLAFGNALNTMENGGLIDDNDINKIKQIPIDHFDGDNSPVGGYHKFISRPVNGGGVINSFGGFGFATYPSDDIISLEEYYKSPYIQHIFYHEVGHYIDLVKNQGTKDFWEICWTNIDTLGQKGNIKNQCDDDAFTENYGMTKPVEDFATVFAINFYPKISYSYTKNNQFLEQKFSFLNSLINKVYPKIITCPNNQHLEYSICVSNTRSCNGTNEYGNQYRNTNTLSWSVCSKQNNSSTTTTNDPCNAPKTSLTYAVMCKDDDGCRKYDQHFENNICIKNTKSCEGSEGGIRKQTRNGNTRGSCELISCKVGYIKDGAQCIENTTYCPTGQHKENDICLSNTKDCTVENGIGTQTWFASVSLRAPCSQLTCDEGYSSYGVSVPDTAWMYEFSCKLLCEDYFHEENNVCVPSQRYCTMTDGRQGTQRWNNNDWDDCKNGCSEDYQIIMNTGYNGTQCVIPSN